MCLFLFTVGSDDMVEKTLKSFLMRAPKTTTNMRNAYDAKDFAKLRRDAHSLKGACGYVASDHLRDSALNLQLAAEAATRGEEVDPPVEACMRRVLSDLDLLCMQIGKVLVRKDPAAPSDGVAAMSIS
jgi:HPt (histidine-containing phosphotransfer) domain-containing protein